jgi:hypothetical protein
MGFGVEYGKSMLSGQYRWPKSVGCVDVVCWLSELSWRATLPTHFVPDEVLEKPSFRLSLEQLR